MKIDNKIPKAIEQYEKDIRQLVNLINQARQSIVNAFIEERKKRRVSLRNAAKQFGISAPYLSDVEKGKRNLTISLFEKIKRF